MNHKVGGETALNEGEASYTEAFHQKRQKSIVVYMYMYTKYSTSIYPIIAEPK